jgi:predicted transcriptional regulator
MSQQPIHIEEEVELSPEELAEVNAGLDEAERGEGTDTFEFLKQLREGTWREGSDRKVNVPLEKQMNEHALEIENTFELSPEEEADLEAAIAEADAGLLVPLEDVLRRMRERSETKH